MTQIISTSKAVSSVCGKKRGHYTLRTVEEKRRIVEATLVFGSAVAVVARRHDVNANQVFRWRQLYHKGALGGPAKIQRGLIAVGIVGVAGEQTKDLPSAASDVSANSRSPVMQALPCALLPAAKSIEIRLRQGTQIRIDGDVELPMVKCVLNMVRGFA